MAGGATLNFRTGTATSLTGLTSLNLGAGSGTATLTLEAGAATTLIAMSTAATTANHIALRVTALAGFTPNTLYTLLAATGGLGSATYDVLIPGYVPVVNVSNTSVTVTATQVAGSLYWRGGIGNSWQSIVSGNTNWTTDSAGLVNALTIPGTINTAVFSANGQAGTTLTTTLDGDVAINDLVFTNNVGSGPLSTINITPGSVAASLLTIAPASSAVGITMQSGSPATVNISSGIKLGASQTWTVADAGSNLNISGSIMGAAGINLVKAGAGTLTLSGTGSTFGGAATTFNVQAGTVRFSADSQLGNALNVISIGTPSSVATLAYTGATATISRALTLGSVANSNVGNTISVDPGNVLTLSGIISGGAPGGSVNTGQQSTNVGLRITGGGTIRLAANNTFLGDLVVGGNSTLSVDALARFGLAGSTNANTPKQVFIQNGSTFIAAGSMNPTTFNGANAVFFAFGENSASSTTLNIASGATLLLDDAGQFTLNGALNVTGAGTLNLATQNYDVATTTFGNSILTTGVNVGSSLNIGGTVTLLLSGSATVLGNNYKVPITMSAGTTLDLRLNGGGNFGNNLTTTGDITILTGRTTAAATVITQTMGTLNLAPGTLTYGLGSLNTAPGVANLTFGATTLNGDTTFMLNHLNGAGTGTLSLGSLNDQGTPRTITVTTSNNSTGILALIAKAASFTGTINVLNNTSLLLGASGATDGTINVLNGAILYNAAKAASGTMNIGDTTGSNSASLLIGANGGTIANPIVLVNGSTGTTTIGNGPTMPIGGIGIIASPLNFTKTSGATNIVVPTGTGLYFTGAVNEGATPLNFNPTTSGIVALLGNKNFTGGLTVAGYKLILGPAAVNYSGATLLNGGAIEFVNGYTLPGNITIGTAPSSIIYTGINGGQDLSSNLTFTDGGTLTVDVVSAANSVTYASAFGNSVNTNFGKAGQGTLTLVGATGGNTFKGNVVVGAGSLVLDFSAAGAPFNNIISTFTGLEFQGGTLTLRGASGGTAGQSFLNGTTLTAGGSTINFIQNGATGLSYGMFALNRNGTSQLGTINFVTSISGSFLFPGYSDNASGIVGGWATVNGTNWATAGSGFLNAYTGDTTDLPASGGSATTNYRYNATTSFTGDVAANALRFTTTGLTLGLGTNNLNLSGSTGGILLGLAAGTITGTTTTASTGFISAAGELLIYVNNGGTLTIGAGIGGTNTNFGITKSGSGTLALTNAGVTKNNYTGATIINGGVLSVTASNMLGATSGITLNGGTLFVNNGSTNAVATITQPLTLGLNGGTLQYSGTANVGGWTSTTPIALIGSGSRTLTLAGTANNRLTPLAGALGDNGGPSSLVISAGGDTTAFQLSAANSFSGTLTINRGIAILNNVSSFPGIAGLTFNGGTGTDQAVLEMTSTSGATFSRELGTLGGQVQWLGNGGFSAGAGTNTPATMAVVNLGALGAKVTWGSGGFVPTGSMLIFNQAMGTTPSVGAIDFQNDLDLGNVLRTIDVENGTYAFNTSGNASNNSAFDARLSGALTSGSGGGITKVGGGVLWLSGNNANFLGSITVTNGTVLFAGTNSLSRALTLTSSTTMVSGAVVQGSTSLAELIAITTPTSDGALLIDTNSSDKINFQAAGLANARFGAFGTAVFQGQFTPGTAGVYKFNGPQANNLAAATGLSALVLPRTDAISGASSTVDFGTGFVLLGSSNNYGDATHGTTLQSRNAIGNNAGGVSSIVAIAKDGALGSGSISLINNQSSTLPTIGLGAAFGDHTLANNIIVNNTGGPSNFNFILAGDTTSDAIPSAGRMTYTGNVNISGTSNLVLNQRTAGFILNGKISGSPIIHLAGGSTLVVFNNLNNATTPSDYTGSIVYLSGGLTLLIGNSRDLGDTATNRVINFNSSAVFGILPGSGDITTSSNITFGDNGNNFNKTIDVPVNQTFKLTSGLVSASRTGQLYTKTGLGTFDIGAILNPGGATATWGAAGITIAQGTLKADFGNAAAATNIIGLANGVAAPLTLAGGNMLLVGKTATANTQAFGALTLSRGANALTLNSNGSTLTTTFTSLGTRAAGATLAITLPTDGPSSITATTGLVAQNNVLVDAATTKSAFAVVGLQGGAVTDWASVSGTTIIPLAAGNYTNTTATTISGNATVAVASTTLSAQANADSLRFRLAQASTLDLGGNTLRVGGVLVTSAVGANLSTISNGSLTTANGATAGADLVFYQDNVGSSLTVSANIVDNAGPVAAALTKSGLGELVLTGTNTYTGATFLNEGTVTISKVGALGSGAGALSLGGATLNYLGTADAGNTGTLTNAVTFARSSTVRVETGASLTLSGAIAGTLLSPNYQVLTKTGTGMLTFSGTAANANLAVDLTAGTLLLSKNGLANSLGIFAGTTLSNVGLTVRSGATARLGGDQVFGDQILNTSSVQVLGTLDLGGHNETIDGLGGNGIITNTATTASVLTIGTSSMVYGAPTLFAGTIQNGPGTVGLSMIGGNIFTLTGTNTYTGKTSIVGQQYGTTGVFFGGISISNASGLGGNPATFTADQWTLNGGRLVATGDVLLDASRNNIGITLGANGGTFEVAATKTVTVGAANTITGAGNLIKEGPGSLTLVGLTNTYTGKTILNGGTLTIASEGALGLNPTAPSPTQLTFNGGSLVTTTNFALDDSNRGVTLAGNGGFIAPAVNTTLTMPNVISGTGNVTVNGAGTVVVSAANTYTGSTFVTSGSLISASGSVATTAGVTISGTGRFIGEGAVGGPVSVGSGASLSVGTNPTNTGSDVGSMTIATSGEALTWSGGSMISFDFGQNPLGIGGAGTDWDLISLTSGHLSIEAGIANKITLHVNSFVHNTSTPGQNGTGQAFDPSLASGSTYQWLFVQGAAGAGGAVDLNGYSGDVNDLFTVDSSGVFGAGLYNPALAGSFYVSVVGNSLYVNYSAVPEPGSLLLIGIAGAGLFGYRRRKRRGQDDTSVVNESVVAEGKGETVATPVG